MNYFSYYCRLADAIAVRLSTRVDRENYNELHPELQQSTIDQSKKLVVENFSLDWLETESKK